MTKAILGRKLGMTQIFAEDGSLIPVTVIEAGPCLVVQKKSTATDGYEAVQVGFIDANQRRVTRPVKGHFGKAGVTPKRFVREFRVDSCDGYEIGQEIKVDTFAAGESVDVTGISRGKGFAGGIKRHGFHRGPMTHGSKYHRAPGSLQSRDASRVFKGRKLPGRMGGEQVTIQNLKVVRVDNDKNLMLVRGAVPGAKGALLVVRKSVKAAE
ncbi:MAG: 50S ribosomal protein L3 [Bacillota bacterium]